MNRVSVIVPVYNSSKYLDDCLKSLVNQTLKKMEIIVIDDASTDNSLAIIRQYMLRYPQIKLLVNVVNLGQSVSRNKGLKIATGEYIGFVDSDDYVHPLMYETLYREAIKYDAKMVNTQLCIVKETDHVPSDWSYFYRCCGHMVDVTKNRDILFDISPSCCNKLFRHEDISNLSFLDNRMWEDSAFCYSSIICGKQLLDIHNCDYFYRKHQINSVSASAFHVNPKVLDIVAVFKEVERVTSEHNCYNEFKKEIGLLASIAILQRIREIFTWNISEEDKWQLVILLDDLICQKYGNWRDIDPIQLCTRVDLIYFDYIGLTSYKNNNKNNEEEIKQQFMKKLSLIKSQ